MMPVLPMPPNPGATNRAERGAGRGSEPDVPFQTVLDHQTAAAGRREPAVTDRPSDRGDRGASVRDAAPDAARRRADHRDAGGAAAAGGPGDGHAEVEVDDEPDDTPQADAAPVDAAPPTVAGEQRPLPAPPAGSAPLPAADPGGVAVQLAPPNHLAPPVPATGAHGTTPAAEEATPTGSVGVTDAPTFAAPSPPPIAEGHPGTPLRDVAVATVPEPPDPTVTPSSVPAGVVGDARPPDGRPAALGSDTATSPSSPATRETTGPAAPADPLVPVTDTVSTTTAATEPTGSSEPTALAPPVVADDAYHPVEPDLDGARTEIDPDDARPTARPTPAASAGHTAVSAAASARPLGGAPVADRPTAPAAAAPPPADQLDVLANAELRRAGSTTTRLGLDVATERLGTIRVDAVDQGGELHLNLSSDRATTRNLLAGELSSLRSDLSDGGGPVHVDVGDRRHATPDRSSIAGDDPEIPTRAGTAGPLAPPDLTTVAPGRLDLRL